MQWLHYTDADGAFLFLDLYLNSGALPRNALKIFVCFFVSFRKPQIKLSSLIKL